MTDMDMEERPEEKPEKRSEEIPEAAATEKVEERLDNEGALTAASAEKEFAGLVREEKAGEASDDTETGQTEAGQDGGIDEEGEEGDEEKKEPPRARGLYRYVKISLPTLNKLIVVLCVALVLCILYGIQDRGYMVDFDSQGGTPVESEKLMYSDKVIPPEEPYREGYIFTGWYTNADCTEEWDLDTGLVGGPMTLYAGWEKKNDE